jgi:hypothetical protein
MKPSKTLIRSLVLAAGIILVATVSSALAMNEDIIGAVVKTDSGAALSSYSGEYLIIGKDLSGMIGKTVAVVGNVEHGVLSKSIDAQSVKVLSNKDLVDPAAAGSPLKRS